jgi:hypothetical protein
MSSRRYLLVGAAAAVTTFLLVGAVTIETLAGLYGDSPGVGILGVFAGFAGALVAGLLVVARGDRLRGVAAAALVAYGTLGSSFLAIALLQYVNVPGADAVFTFPVHLGTSVLLAVVAGALDAQRPRGPEAATA